MKRLRVSALAALEERDATYTSSVHGGIISVRAQLPALEAWLRHNSTVTSAIAAYLGGHAMLHGYKVVHMPEQVANGSYIASLWHHDRAGRRLKLFIPLHDIDG